MQDCTPEELQSWRARMGLTQAEAAEKLGISLRAYSDRENGNTSIALECMLACQMIEHRMIWQSPSEASNRREDEAAAWLGISKKSLRDELYAQTVILDALVGVLAKTDWFTADNFNKAVGEQSQGILDGPSYAEVNAPVFKQLHSNATRITQIITMTKQGLLG